MYVSDQGKITAALISNMPPFMVGMLYTQCAFKYEKDTKPQQDVTTYCLNAQSTVIACSPAEYGPAKKPNGEIMVGFKAYHGIDAPVYPVKRK
jgi:hypothetical protein